LAAQVRRLKSNEADRRIPARIRGVVIYARPNAMVLQDSSGGVFVSSGIGDWTEQPEVGELWEIEGATRRGDFSPVITANAARFIEHVAMPEPVRPTRDQLMNGNLDAEYVELRGILTAISTNE